VNVVIITTPPFGTLDIDFISPLALFLIRFQPRPLNELTPFLGMGAGPGSGKDAEFTIYSQAGLYTASSSTNTYEFKTQFQGLL